MGVPVVSIEEKGKFVQKTAGGSELLVPPTAQSLAEGAARILSDGSLRLKMAREGKETLGGPGALDTVVAHAAGSMGWDLRCRLFSEALGAMERTVILLFCHPESYRRRIYGRYSGESPER